MKASRSDIAAMEKLAMERGGTVGSCSVCGVAEDNDVTHTCPPGFRLFTVRIPGWRPTSLNKLLYAKVSERIRLKKADSEMVGTHCHLADIPRATCKRRVSIQITLGPRQKEYDDGNARKSIFDGLVACGRLVNDNRAWSEEGPVTWLPRGSGTSGTILTLEDVP